MSLTSANPDRLNKYSLVSESANLVDFINYNLNIRYKACSSLEFAYVLFE